MSPRFSIVVPCFQAENTIESAIKSLQIQDFSDWEAVLIDDGSTDKTRELINFAKKEDSRIRYFYSSTNSGPGPPKNYGIRHSTGDYVLFLDADDELVENSLSQLDSDIGAHSPDIVLFRARERRGKREKNLHEGPFPLDRTPREKLVSIEDCPQLLMWPPASWTRAYRKKFLEENSFSFPDGTYEDIPWAVETSLRANSIQVTNSTVYRYITRGANSSITTSRSKKSLDRVVQVHRARDIAHSENTSDLTLKYLSALAAVHLIWANLAAYRTVPAHLQERFFVKCSLELNSWLVSGILDRSVRSEPLLETRQRLVLARAMLSGDYSRWRKTLSRRTTLRRWRRRLTPGRYRSYFKR